MQGPDFVVCIDILPNETTNTPTLSRPLPALPKILHHHQQ
jgi:hypothetical protein